MKDEGEKRQRQTQSYVNRWNICMIRYTMWLTGAHWKAETTQVFSNREFNRENWLQRLEELEKQKKEGKKCVKGGKARNKCPWAWICWILLEMLFWLLAEFPEEGPWESGITPLPWQQSPATWPHCQRQNQEPRLLLLPSNLQPILPRGSI